MVKRFISNMKVQCLKRYVCTSKMKLLLVFTFFFQTSIIYTFIGSPAKYFSKTQSVGISFKIYSHRKVQNNRSRILPVSIRPPDIFVTPEYLRQNATSNSTDNDVTLVKDPLVLFLVTSQGRDLDWFQGTIRSTWGGLVQHLNFIIPEGVATHTACKYCSVVKSSQVVNSEFPQTVEDVMISSLRHICEVTSFVYDWYVLTTVRSYVHVSKLMSLLALLDPATQIYIGRPGELWDNDSYTNDTVVYCQQPTIIFSTGMLKGLCPLLSSCNFTSEPDEDIGRCIANHFSVHCALASGDVTSDELFYNASALPPTSVIQHNNEVDLLKAVSVFNVNSASTMQAIHSVYLSNRNL